MTTTTTAVRSHEAAESPHKADYETYVDSGLKRLAQPGTPPADYSSHVDGGVRKLLQHPGTPLADYQCNVSGVGDLLLLLTPQPVQQVQHPLAATVALQSEPEVLVCATTEFDDHSVCSYDNSIAPTDSTPVLRNCQSLRKSSKTRRRGEGLPAVKEEKEAEEEEKKEKEKVEEAEEKPKPKRGGGARGRRKMARDELEEMLGFSETPSRARRTRVSKILDEMEDQDAVSSVGIGKKKRMTRGRKSAAEERLDEHFQHVDAFDETADAFFASIEQVNTTTTRSRRARREAALADIFDSSVSVNVTKQRKTRATTKTLASATKRPGRGGRRQTKCTADQSDLLGDSPLGLGEEAKDASAAAAKPTTTTTTRASRVSKKAKIILPAFEAASGVIYQADIDAAAAAQSRSPAAK